MDRSIGTAQSIANIDDPATGSLAVTGTAIVGGSLTASLTAVVDPDGTATVGYRWQELLTGNWIDITGQTSAIFNIADNALNVGKQVRVIATTTDPFNGKTDFTSAESIITGTIVTDDREATGTLSVSGTPAEGGTLTANLTNVVDADGTTTTAYRWQSLDGSNWVNLPGQTAAILSIASDQSMVGKQVRVIATTADIQGGTTEFIGNAQTIGSNTIPLDPSPSDLVFYDPITGQVSFAFTGSTFSTITTEGADTPVLTKNDTNATTTPFGSGWRLVSAGVDVDKDGVKDLILTLNANNAVAVVFGAARTGTSRQFSYRNSAFVQANGVTAAPGTTWTLDFASNKIGANDSPGLFWRSNAGDVAIWSLSTTTTAGETSVSLANSGIIASVGNSGWKAIGDGEFNATNASREVLWTNDPALSIASWSLNSARTSRIAKFAASGPVPTNSFGVIGITNISGTGNDNVIWQSKTGSTLIVWNMVDGAYAATGSASALTPVVISLTAGDRIKSFADVDVDGVIDLIGQGSDGSIAAYALTSGFALKNTAAPRTQYSSNNPGSYRPAKGGFNASTLELVNVAQYGA
jgi:hypothetical protein